MDSDALQVLAILSNTLGQYIIILMAFVTGALSLFVKLKEAEDKNIWIKTSFTLILLGALISLFALLETSVIFGRIDKNKLAIQLGMRAASKKIKR